MDLGLRDKAVLVAAASKGLGRAVAAEFAREGAQVAICSRGEAAITMAAEEIARETKGARVLPVAADLSTKEGCETFVRSALGAYGKIDVLVVNAGGPPPGRFDDLDDATWQEAIDLMLFSAIRLTRLALPELRRSKGSIVYMTSTTVRQPTQYLNLILSNAIRASVHGMLKTLSADLAKEGVRVNAVQPGRLSTDRIVQLDTDNARRAGKTMEEVREQQERNIPLGRYGRPEEFAAAVVFLASARASYITGTSLQVDGGALHAMF